MSTYSPGGADSVWRPDPRPSRIVLFPVIALACIAALAAATIYLYIQVEEVRAEMNDRLRTYSEQFSKLEASVKGSTKVVDSKVQELRGAADTARTKIEQSAKEIERQAVSKAEKAVQEAAQKLEVKHSAAITAVGGEIRQLREATQQTSTQLGSLSGEVTEVKRTVGQTQSELQATIAALKSVRGDLGVQSGLIATNAKELQALRELGQRNYIEFRLSKTKQPQQVGDIRIKLKKTDTKRNRFTIDLWADDRQIEKKDRTINEPVQFYMAQRGAPHELVVNQVQKDLLVGYLSTPRADRSRP
jgi:chromosome segregation ATPase